MPKLKTNKSAKKRIKVTNRGLLMRHRAGRRHILTSKASKRKRMLRKDIALQGMEAKIIKKLLPYG